jgi:hypothetical protein
MGEGQDERLPSTQDLRHFGMSGIAMRLIDPNAPNAIRPPAVAADVRERR